MNGEQLTQPKAPPQGATERVKRKATAGEWGHLPPYLQKIFRKFGKVDVPAKYRRFLEEFHRKADRKKRRNGRRK